MTNKERFIEEIEELLADHTKTFGENGLSDEAYAYFESLKATEEKPEFTENGAKVLIWMRENEAHYNNIFKAKEIAEGLFTNSRSVSGSMRKLVTDGFVLKTGTNPSCYSLTDKGRECTVSLPEDAEG